MLRWAYILLRHQVDDSSGRMDCLAAGISGHRGDRSARASEGFAGIGPERPRAGLRLVQSRSRIELRHDAPALRSADTRYHQSCVTAAMRGSVITACVEVYFAYVLVLVSAGGRPIAADEVLKQLRQSLPCRAHPYRAGWAWRNKTSRCQHLMFVA
jgi:hypothetical protein